MLLVDNESGAVMPVGNEQKAYLALRINAFSATRLTESLQRLVGHEYLASTCCGVYAIVRVTSRGRESVRAESWAEALDRAKKRWGWTIETAEKGGRRECQ